MMTLSYLSTDPHITLSSEELLDISQAINSAFALQRVNETRAPREQDNLSPAEMLAISTEISQDFAPSTSNNAEALVLLPVDPEHLYAYWHVDDSNAIQSADERELTLRLYTDQAPVISAVQPSPWFDFALDSYQAQQQITLPEQTPKGSYHASLGIFNAHQKRVPLADSNSIYLPSRPRTSQDAMLKNDNIMPRPIVTHADKPRSPTHHASGPGKTQQAQ